MTVPTTSDDGLRERVPRARCHACGEMRIAALCCICSRFLCAKHDKVTDLAATLRKANGLARRSLIPTAPAGRSPDAESSAVRPPTSTAKGGDAVTVSATTEPAEEPAGSATKPAVTTENGRTGANQPAHNQIPIPHRHWLRRPATPSDDGMGNRGTDGHPRSAAEPMSVQQRHFCADCLPVLGPHDLQLIGGVAGCVVGTLLLLVSTVLGIAVLVASVGWLAVRLGTGLQRRRSIERRVQKLLFLDPLIKKLELTETVSGSYCLNPALLVVRSVKGTVDVRLAWTRGQATKADRWRRRYKGTGDNGLRAEAGHLVLRGAGQPGLTAPDGCEVAHPARVRLHPKLDDQPWLAGPDVGGDALWNFQLTYEPPRPDGGWRLPMWVTPSITPDSERRSLDLRIQWRTAEPLAEPDDRPPLTAKELTSVHVDVPARWGAVHQVTGDNVEQTLVGVAPDGRTRIEWRKPKIAETSRGERLLSVSFSDPIRAEDKIDGSLEATFTQAASGTEGVRMFAAGGGRRRDGARPTVKTKISVEFELRLGGVRHQASRTVPDSTKDEFARDPVVPGDASRPAPGRAARPAAQRSPVPRQERGRESRPTGPGRWCAEPGVGRDRSPLPRCASHPAFA